jgi:hypothetical protein
MARKKKTQQPAIKDGANCELYVLPSDNDELCDFIKKYRTEMSEQIISAIDYAIKNNLPMVEVFQFKNSDFVITLSKPQFREHLDHIFSYYMDNEKYELCTRVTRLQSELTNKPNEKEKPEKPTRGSPSTHPKPGS